MHPEAVPPVREPVGFGLDTGRAERGTEQECVFDADGLVVFGVQEEGGRGVWPGVVVRRVNPLLLPRRIFANEISSGAGVCGRERHRDHWIDCHGRIGSGTQAVRRIKALDP